MRSRFFSARYFSMYSSWMGDFRWFTMSTFSGMISTAITWLCWERRVASERPTYPVPATAIFMPFLHVDQIHAVLSKLGAAYISIYRCRYYIHSLFAIIQYLCIKCSTTLCRMENGFSKIESGMSQYGQLSTQELSKGSIHNIKRYNYIQSKVY